MRHPEMGSIIFNERISKILFGSAPLLYWFWLRYKANGFCFVIAMEGVAKEKKSILCAKIEISLRIQEKIIWPPFLHSTANIWKINLWV